LNPRRPTPEDLPLFREYALKQCEKREKRIENGQNKRIDINQLLKDFEMFCKVDLQLADLSIRNHIREIKRFLKATKLNPYTLSKSDLRNYLAPFSEKNPYVYKTVLAALKRFFRDFLERPDVVEGLHFPKYPLEPKKVPSKKELQRFYETLEDDRERALFLMFATTGLRKSEVLNLKIEDIDLEERMVTPKAHRGRTKRVWVSFFNEECQKVLKRYLSKRNDNNPKLFPISRVTLWKIFRRGRDKINVHLNPQILREWFCSEMGRLGVPDRYVDAFCGRIPRSVLARHYTDFSPEKLREIYDKANLKVLN
jgi:integrase/recombinase XerD